MNDKKILYEAVYWHDQHQSLMRTPLDATHIDDAIAEAKQRQAIMGRLQRVEVVKTSVVYTAPAQSQAETR